MIVLLISVSKRGPWLIPYKFGTWAATWSDNAVIRCPQCCAYVCHFQIYYETVALFMFIKVDYPGAPVSLTEIILTGNISWHGWAIAPLQNCVCNDVSTPNSCGSGWSLSTPYDVIKPGNTCAVKGSYTEVDFYRQWGHAASSLG